MASPRTVGYNFLFKPLAPSVQVDPRPWGRSQCRSLVFLTRKSRFLPLIPLPPATIELSPQMAEHQTCSCRLSSSPDIEHLHIIKVSRDHQPQFQFQSIHTPPTFNNNNNKRMDTPRKAFLAGEVQNVWDQYTSDFVGVSCRKNYWTSPPGTSE